MKKWHEEEKQGYNIIYNEGGATLSYSPASGMKILEEDGFAFKDLNGSGMLEPYKDWRLPLKERVKDLTARMSLEEMAGLMLYSGHQSVKRPGNDMFAKRFAGTYDGKPLDESEADISDLTDQQKKFLTEDNLRHVLVTSLEDNATCARWSNNMQALCEGIGKGIPVSISSDPRHGTVSNGEYVAGGSGAISEWPSSLGMAATFEPEQVERFGQVAAKEYRALGITTALSPQIDLATEPRWNRFDGTFGEGTKLSVDMARAYCDGFQTSEGDKEIKEGWGYESVNAMAKHWPGGGAGEGGRDAHFSYGKFAVYPGDNFKEAMLPFTEGAFKLKGKTKQAAAVMPYYTVSYNQDKRYCENVGNSYSRYIIGELLREKTGYDGIVCTDWGITHTNTAIDEFGHTCWGTEQLSENERHYKALLAGVDQFGGNNDAKPVVAAYHMMEAAYGQEWARKRFERSAGRLLTAIFRTGLFENPYLDPERASEIVGSPEFMKEGYEAQRRSVVMLKNKNGVLPMSGQPSDCAGEAGDEAGSAVGKGARKKVFIPRRVLPPMPHFFGMTPPVDEPAVPEELVNKYFDLAKTPEEADFAIVFIDSPNSQGYDRQRGGYLPITLQYRPYKADTARTESIASGDPWSENPNRAYHGRENTPFNACQLDQVIDTKKAMGDKPVIVSLTMKNPTVPAEFEPYADAILIDFNIQKQVILEACAGVFEPSGLLPCQMPADMLTVEANCEDVPRDMIPYKDEMGNCYDYAFGMNFSGVILDERVKKYR